jgi:hypothetical protein
MSLANLKRASAKIHEQTKASADQESTKRSYADDRYWSPIVDKNNNGSAIIRFLPGILVKDANNPNYNSPYVQSLLRSGHVDGEPQYEPSYVRKWTHGFKGPNGLWYIENNRNSLGTKEEAVDDPCTDYNSDLWKTNDAEHREQARKQKRKLLYISNIYVVKHAARPDDEGKVFLFAYGKKVFDKIVEAMDGATEEESEPLQVFNLWEGANFSLKIKNVEGFRNYDSSKFLTPKPLKDDDDELEEIFNQEHSLLDEVGLDKFKSYDALQKHLNRVLGLVVEEEEKPRTAPARTPPVAARSEVSMTETEEEEEVPFDVDEDGVVTDKPAKNEKTTDMKSFFNGLKNKKA